jgi:hypothetical protein
LVAQITLPVARSPVAFAGELLVAGQDVADEAGGGEQVRRRREGDDDAGGDPQPAATMIASATGHQCSPRPAAGSGITGEGAAG